MKETPPINTNKIHDEIKQRFWKCNNSVCSGYVARMVQRRKGVIPWNAEN